MIADPVFDEAHRLQRAATLQRLRDGMNRIAEAVQRLNDLGKPLGVPPVSIRFQPSPSPFGDIHFDNHVADMMYEAAP